MHQHRVQKGVSRQSMVLVLCCAAVAVGVVVSAINGEVSRGDLTIVGNSTSNSPTGRRPFGQSSPERSTEPSPQHPFAVTVFKPSGPPRVTTGVTDLHGNPVSVGCATCHATRGPNYDNKVPSDLGEFHDSLRFDHGNISCLSCHNPEDYDALKLADGSRVEFTDVMTLCAQCHGSQMKDYEHGAHGGMNGYWDLTRGSRVKNNCVDCHYPHSPQFPRMQPTFKPRDRFLSTPKDRQSHRESDRESDGQSHRETDRETDGAQTVEPPISGHSP